MMAVACDTFNTRCQPLSGPENDAELLDKAVFTAGSAAGVRGQIGDSAEVRLTLLLTPTLWGISWSTSAAAVCRRPRRRGTGRGRALGPRPSIGGHRGQRFAGGLRFPRSALLGGYNYVYPQGLCVRRIYIRPDICGGGASLQIAASGGAGCVGADRGHVGFEKLVKKGGNFASRVERVRSRRWSIERQVDGRWAEYVPTPT